MTLHRIKGEEFQVSTIFLNRINNSFDLDALKREVDIIAQSEFISSQERHKKIMILNRRIAYLSINDVHEKVNKKAWNILYVDFNN